MKFKMLIAALMLMCFASTASAQFASRFTWGPTIPMFKVSIDDSLEGDRGTFLSAGAGFFLGANLAPTADGRWRMITFSLPVFINYEDGFGLDAGLMIGTLNNLLSAGIGTGLLSDGQAVEDVFSRENTYILISASLNFGSGGPGSEAQQRALGAKEAAGETFHTRPPGYVGW